MFVALTFKRHRGDVRANIRNEGRNDSFVQFENLGTFDGEKPDDLWW